MGRFGKFREGVSSRMSNMRAKQKANRTNARAWDRISNQDIGESLKYRDVYEKQQLGRSELGKKRSPWIHRTASIVATILVFIASWFLISAGSYAVWLVQGFGVDKPTVSKSGQPIEYIDHWGLEHEGTLYTCYGPIPTPGAEVDKTECYLREEAVKPPQWWIDDKPDREATLAEYKAQLPPGPGTYGGEVLTWHNYKAFLSFLIAITLGGLLYGFLNRKYAAANLMTDVEDINQYANDQHIQVPEEVIQNYDVFPDVGAHSAVVPSSMISHFAMSAKGLKKVEVAERAKKDIKGEDGEVVTFKGEILYEPDVEEDGQIYEIRDEDGNPIPITKTLPIIDEDFGTALFEASEVFEKKMQRRFDTTKLAYNPDGSNRDKLGKFKTIADLINADWEFPIYETQRPAGAYVVDTAPVNTMVLAITRAGKGQTYIEPMLDMWSRVKEANNMVINDPKGELLVKNYVPFTLRGFQVIQFNLINAMKTDIYNPLGMAAEAAREGDSVKCALYVENIAEVFFPVDGADDPVWPNAANNAFKRAAYGLIDFYLEEERAIRQKAMKDRTPAKVLETQLDALWGKVTLYNCYQLFVQLSSKKMKRPSVEIGMVKKKLDEALNNLSVRLGKPVTELSNEDKGRDATVALWENKFNEVQARESWEDLWDNDEHDLLTLFFAATDRLPVNSMRTLVGNANNALKSIGGADKMLASVYGIAITAMSFFADPTIATLTSGTPSQNTDLGSFSFPRRMGVRFDPSYVAKQHLIGAQARWMSYSDDSFSEKAALGKDFYHEDTVTREGWARYYFKGIYPNEVSYIKLQLVNASTGMLIKEFFFRFTKSYQTTLNGRHYVKDPILEKKIVHDGLLEELGKATKKDENGEVIAERWVVNDSKYHKNMLEFVYGDKQDSDDAGKDEESRELITLQPVRGKTNMFIYKTVRYTETPKALFMVTPPHLMKYAKLLLIGLKQLVDLNFDRSYMTKSTQKPLYKTQFMLDELGNLQSEGHGIAGFETMLSIGLGQEQQFTLILQTLQQLRDVYGDSVDKIVQGNAQPLDSKVLLTTGFTRMGDIKVGNEVVTPSRKVSKVSGVYPRGVRKVYKLTLKDGRTVKACGEHLWVVRRKRG